MHEKAIEYLRALHTLEMAAGLNFRAAKVDLIKKRGGNLGLINELDQGLREEMFHAYIVRDMLAALGYDDTADLMKTVDRFIKTLSRDYSHWPSEYDAPMRIALNFKFESFFAYEGCDRFLVHMQRFSTQLAWGEGRERFIHALCRFCKVAMEDEPRHVQLDQKVLNAYKTIWPSMDFLEKIEDIPVGKTPFIHIIRARQEFIRSLPSEDRLIDGEPESSSEVLSASL